MDIKALFFSKNLSISILLVFLLDTTNYLAINSCFSSNSEHFDGKDVIYCATNNEDKDFNI